jgi:hypothetical protein
VIASSGAEEDKAENIFSAEIQAAVRGELEMILAAPSFAQSNRCKKFLSFVVLQTLSGHASQLKERTVGIGVFGRANDYDTGGDSIVRVTSNEVRKRIDQFYRESRISHPIQIELARGSYVPEFRIHPSRQLKEAAPIAASESLNKVTFAGDTSATVELPSPSGDRIDETASVQAPIAFTDTPRNTHSRKFLVSIALIVLLLIGGATTLEVWRSRARNKIPQVWEAFQRSNVPVLICLGTHDLPASNVASSPETEKFNDLVLRKEIIPVDDVTVITSMASLLGKKGIPFRVVGAGQTSLTDLRRQPIILIGAADNKWTLRLSRDLRYRIEFVPPGRNQVPIASIVDSQQPGSVPWRLDFSIPMQAWKNDYAIVARVDDPITGVSVLIDAGLGNDGSLAASELIASDQLTEALANEPHCSGKASFEAVIGTEIIDAKPGPPHILRLQCW